ncbi:unnamed protein product [Diplocarpon coronariae]
MPFPSRQISRKWLLSFATHNQHLPSTPSYLERNSRTQIVYRALEVAIQSRHFVARFATTPGGKKLYFNESIDVVQMDCYFSEAANHAPHLNAPEIFPQNSTVLEDGGRTAPGTFVMILKDIHKSRNGYVPFFRQPKGVQVSVMDAFDACWYHIR